MAVVATPPSRRDSLLYWKDKLMHQGGESGDEEEGEVDEGLAKEQRSQCSPTTNKKTTTTTKTTTFGSSMNKGRRGSNVFCGSSSGGSSSSSSSNNERVVGSSRKRPRSPGSHQQHRQMSKSEPYQHVTRRPSCKDTLHPNLPEIHVGSSPTKSTTKHHQSRHTPQHRSVKSNTSTSSRVTSSSLKGRNTSTGTGTSTSPALAALKTPPSSRKVGMCNTYIRTHQPFPAGNRKEESSRPSSQNTIKSKNPEGKEGRKNLSFTPRGGVKDSPTTRESDKETQSPRAQPKESTSAKTHTNNNSSNDGPNHDSESSKKVECSNKNDPPQPTHRNTDSDSHQASLQSKNDPTSTASPSKPKRLVGLPPSRFEPSPRVLLQQHKQEQLGELELKESSKKGMVVSSNNTTTKIDQQVTRAEIQSAKVNLFGDTTGTSDGETKVDASTEKGATGNNVTAESCAAPKEERGSVSGDVKRNSKEDGPPRNMPEPRIVPNPDGQRFGRLGDDRREVTNNGRFQSGGERNRYVPGDKQRQDNHFIRRDRGRFHSDRVNFRDLRIHGQYSAPPVREERRDPGMFDDRSIPRPDNGSMFNGRPHNTGGHQRRTFSSRPPEMNNRTERFGMNERGRAHQHHHHHMGRRDRQQDPQGQYSRNFRPQGGPPGPPGHSKPHIGHEENRYQRHVPQRQGDYSAESSRQPPGSNHDTDQGFIRRRMDHEAHFANQQERFRPADGSSDRREPPNADRQYPSRDTPRREYESDIFPHRGMGHNENRHRQPYHTERRNSFRSQQDLSMKPHPHDNDAAPWKRKFTPSYCDNSIDRERQRHDTGTMGYGKANNDVGFQEGRTIRREMSREERSASPPRKRFCGVSVRDPYNTESEPQVRTNRSFEECRQSNSSFSEVGFRNVQRRGDRRIESTTSWPHKDRDAAPTSSEKVMPAPRTVMRMPELPRNRVQLDTRMHLPLSDEKKFNKPQYQEKMLVEESSLEDKRFTEGTAWNNEKPVEKRVEQPIGFARSYEKADKGVASRDIHTVSETVAPSQRYTDAAVEKGVDVTKSKTEKGESRLQAFGPSKEKSSKKESTEEQITMKAPTEDFRANETAALKPAKKMILKLKRLNQKSEPPKKVKSSMAIPTGWLKPKLKNKVPPKLVRKAEKSTAPTKIISVPRKIPKKDAKYPVLDDDGVKEVKKRNVVQRPASPIPTNRFVTDSEGGSTVSNSIMNSISGCSSSSANNVREAMQRSDKKCDEKIPSAIVTKPKSNKTGENTINPDDVKFMDSPAISDLVVKSPPREKESRPKKTLKKKKKKILRRFSDNHKPRVEKRTFDLEDSCSESEQQVNSSSDESSCDSSDDSDTDEEEVMMWASKMFGVPPRPMPIAHPKKNNMSTDRKLLPDEVKPNVIKSERPKKKPPPTILPTMPSSQPVPAATTPARKSLKHIIKKRVEASFQHTEQPEREGRDTDDAYLVKKKRTKKVKKKKKKKNINTEKKEKKAEMKYFKDFDEEDDEDQEEVVYDDDYNDDDYNDDDEKEDDEEEWLDEPERKYEPEEEVDEEQQQRDFQEERRKREAAKPLTMKQIKAILRDDDFQPAARSNWVRRSVRQPSKALLRSKPLKSLVHQLKMNDPDMIVLKMKKYINDPDAPEVVLDAALEALEENRNCEALYIQNFNNGMRDRQIIHLLKILQQPTCKIWCLNIGETYNVDDETWERFTRGLRRTKVTHMYASEHTITSEMKDEIRTIIRENRTKHDMHINPNNLDVIVQCTHCWWNPINAKCLRPYLKNNKEYEHILNDSEVQGLRGSSSAAPAN